ncbi:hypothetical protein BU17DRAFT_50663, partial [Hysterangium stoloniferum]
IHFKWVTRHEGIKGNELADNHAKATTEGSCSMNDSLPPILHKCLPTSIATLKATYKTMLIPNWLKIWKLSARYS